MTEGLEIEVKRSVADPAAVRAVLERGSSFDLGGFEAAGPSRVVEVLDRYIDTADGSLDRAGLRVRLRNVGSAVLVTVKGPATEAAGVTSRRELEAPAADDLDSEAWPASAPRSTIEAVTAGLPLQEVGRLRQHRLVRDVRRGETHAELSLDHLEALTGDAVRAERWELEAELKAGSPADLAELAAALDRVPGVGPALGSKRSFALAGSA